MYHESEYIYQEFEAHFSNRKKEPLVLYGIGKNTGELLEKIQDYQIAGLMDGKRKEGNIWNKPILDYKDVLALNVKTIVIIARPAVIGVIYHRISDFCSQNSITVYDVRGKDLSEIYVNQEQEIPYFKQSFEDLKKAIEKHTVISFDVFDTLMMRKILYPEDIFTVVEKRKPFPGFAALRTEAERQLYEEKQNPTFVEIYERLQRLGGMDEEQKEELKALELAVEMEFVVPRKRMLSVFNSIKGKKKIYLISDMYLPGKEIEKLLKKCGYEGYEELYVSCEKGTSKNEALFDVYLKEREQEGYRNFDCLHIGDNETADIMSPKEAGIDAFQVMSARELLESSAYRKLLSSDLCFMDHLALGLFCEKAFQDPFALYGTKGKLKIENLRKFSYLLIAPMIFYFTVWLMQQVCEFGCDYVLYPSRDAYLIERLCRIICGIQSEDTFPNGEYFYASRRAVLAATIWNHQDIYHVAEADFGGSVSQLLKKRFRVEINGDGESVEAKDKEKLKCYLEKYQQRILDQSAAERENYLHYISKTGICGHRKLALIDFVAAGKIQNGLEKLALEKEFQGFYFLRREPNIGEIDRDIQVETFFPSKGAFEIDLNVYKYYLFLEMVLTSPEPTFDCIGDEGELIFMEETRTKEHRDIVNEIQESILEYAREFSKLCPNLREENVSRTTPDMILGFLAKEYTELSMPEVTSLVLTDEFLSQTYNIFQG